jgi:riboflavin kinase/FMN adenylyltransferase
MDRVRIFRHSFDPQIAATAVAVGNFDGLHRGHRLILDLLVEEAHQQGLYSLVYTFYPHPQKFLSGKAPQQLMTLSTRLRGICDWEIDGIVIRRFDEHIAGMRAEEFLAEELVGRLRARLLLVGETHALGQDRQGKPKKLVQVGEKMGLQVLVVPALRCRNRNISSSELRLAISKGDLSFAQEFLGRPVSLEGRVIGGYGRGQRDLGIPTANLAIPADIVSPCGVFAARCYGSFGERLAVVNIGTCPTFGNRDRSVEVHLIDFEGDLRRERLKLDLLAKLREERDFLSVLLLRRQIGQDIAMAQELFPTESHSIGKSAEE